MVTKMKANFHTHTMRCRHAVGRDIDYAKAAYDAGIRTLGFSDHTPYVGFEGDYYSTFRMFPEEIADYCDSIKSLREQFRGKMDIYIGLEVEYYPKLFPKLIEFLRPYDIDYIILGQHYNDDDQYGEWTRWVKTDESLKTYVDQCCEAMETGLFSYVAHPDIAEYDRSGPAFDREFRRLCRTAKNLDIPLELNLLGIRTKRGYPCTEFFKIAAEEDCRIILGRDAHEPHAFYETEYEEAALEMVHDLGLKLCEDIDPDRLKKYYGK